MGNSSSMRAGFGNSNPQVADRADVTRCGVEAPLGQVTVSGSGRVDVDDCSVSNCQDLCIDLGQVAVPMGGVTDC